MKKFKLNFRVSSLTALLINLWSLTLSAFGVPLCSSATASLVKGNYKLPLEFRLATSRWTESFWMYRCNAHRHWCVEFFSPRLEIKHFGLFHSLFVFSWFQFKKYCKRHEQHKCVNILACLALLYWFDFCHFVTELCGLVLISTNLTQFVELLKEPQTLWLMTEKPSVVDFS